MRDAVGAAPTGSRWPAATARRRSSRRSPPSTACPTPASRPARATTSRSTSASTATTSSARSTRSSTAASGVVDLAEVNGRVFVNNVSLGLYAEAVQREGYRDAKLRTLLDTVPGRARPATAASSTCAGPGRAATSTAPAPRSWSPTTATGSAAPSARARARGSTTACWASRSSAPRPGAARAAGALQRPWREWSAPAFDVDAERPGPGRHRRRGARAEPPLRFRIRPGVLRVRIARAAPRRLAVGDRCRRAPGRRRRAGADRRRPRTRTRPPPPRRPAWT